MAATYVQDKRPQSAKAMDKKLKEIKFPYCFGRCPDIGRSCPSKEEFDKFLGEHKAILIRDFPDSWECRTCIYTDTL